MPEKTPTSSASEQTLLTVRTWLRVTMLCLVFTYGFTYFSGWFNLAVVLGACLTMGLAITTMVKMAKARFPVFSIMLTVLIIIWAFMLALTAGVQLLFADAAGAYSDCLRQAVTLSGEDQCLVQMNDGLLKQLTGGN